MSKIIARNTEKLDWFYFVISTCMEIGLEYAPLDTLTVMTFEPRHASWTWTPIAQGIKGKPWTVVGRQDSDQSSRANSRVGGEGQRKSIIEMLPAFYLFLLYHFCTRAPWSPLTSNFPSLSVFLSLKPPGSGIRPQTPQGIKSVLGLSFSPLFSLFPG